MGWTQTSPLDSIGPKPKTDLPSIDTLRASLGSSFKDAHFAHKLCQAHQSAYSSQKCRPHSYKVGEFVWLDMRYSTDLVYKLQTSKNSAHGALGNSKFLNLLGKIRSQLNLHTRFVLTMLFMWDIPSRISYCHRTSPCSVRHLLHYILTRIASRLLN